MVLMTMIARVIDGLPLAATMQEDEQSGCNVLEYQNQAKMLFKKLGPQSPLRCSIETGPYLFHYLIENEICYLVLCERNYSKRLAFSYLEEIAQEFYQQYGKRLINVPTAGAQAFPMDGLGRMGHDPSRGPSAGWWVLTTADAARTNGLTCLPIHGGARDSKFLVTHPMTDHYESCSTSTTAAERANH
ncbi:hypothetical protein evm_014091 [Chilo suppressalis]|nr:hypothetical protein evm_014091 [Chilo suppressalis]